MARSRRAELEHLHDLVARGVSASPASALGIREILTDAEVRKEQPILCDEPDRLMLGASCVRSAVSTKRTPSNAMRPWSGVRSPAIRAKVVDFPEPDGPKSAATGCSASKSSENKTSSVNCPDKSDCGRERQGGSSDSRAREVLARDQRPHGKEHAQQRGLPDTLGAPRLDLPGRRRPEACASSLDVPGEHDRRAELPTPSRRRARCRRGRRAVPAEG